MLKGEAVPSEWGEVGGGSKEKGEECELGSRKPGFQTHRSQLHGNYPVQSPPPILQQGKQRPKQGKELAHSASASSLKTSNVLRGRRDLPSTPDSAMNSPVTLLRSLGSHSTKQA